MKNERENRRDDGFNKRPRRTPSPKSNPPTGQAGMSEDEIVRGWKKDSPSYKNNDSQNDSRPPRRENSRGDYADRKPRNDRRDGDRNQGGGYNRGGDDRRPSWEKPSGGGRSDRGERGGYSDRNNSNDRRPSNSRYGDNKRNDDRPQGGGFKRDGYGDRRNNDSRGSGDRNRSWDKPQDNRSERRGYGDRDRNSDSRRPSNNRYGDDNRRPSWEKSESDRPQRSGYGDRRPSDNRGSSDRNRDDRRPSNNRYGNDRRNNDRPQGRDYDNRRPSWEKNDNERGERNTYSDRRPSRYGDNDRTEFKPKRGATKYDADRQKGFRDKKGNGRKKHNGPSEYGKPRKENEPLRLNRYIANAGICSRREADTLIAEGHVTVNGDKVTEMGYKVLPNDKVMYKDKLLTLEKFVYMVMNKPKNTITTLKDPEGRQTVIDLLQEETEERVYPVGRLDRNTTGVLLFTNDGEFAQAMTHPSSEVEKVYKATLDRAMTPKDMEKMVEGFELEDGFTQVDSIAYVEKNDNKTMGVVIHSGRNRIIHRMFNHLGYTVEKLDRTSFAGIDKHDIKRGKVRFLREKEINALKRITRKNRKQNPD